jgi:branched-chain amino acid transport system substrate-binding protein
MGENMMKKNRMVALIIFIVSIASTFGIVDAGNDTTIKIGALLPLTGAWSEAGQGAKQALTLGLAEVNYYLKDAGIQLDIDIRDTGGNAAKALQELETMQRAGIDTVLGPMSSEESLHVLKYADEHSILLLSPSATSPDLARRDNFFRMVATDASQADGLARIIKDNYKINRLMVVYRDDVYGRGYYGELLKMSQSLAIKMIGAISLPLDPSAYGSVATKLEEFARAAEGAEAAVVLISSSQNAAELIKQIPATGKLTTFKWFCGADIIGSKAFLEDETVAAFAAKTKLEGLTIGYKGVALDALPYIGSLLEGAADLSPYAITSWDSLWLLAETYKRAPRRDVAALKKTLPEIAKVYRNANGAFNVMDENGDTASARFMRYRLDKENGNYTWRCLGHYVNLGVGDPILQTIQWTVAGEGRQVPVGVLLSLSGSHFEKGKEIESILRYAEKSFNRYASECASKLRIQLVIEDTQSSPEKAKIAAQKLIDMGIKSIIGPTSSTELKEVKPLVDASGIILISPLSSAPSLGKEDRIYRLVLNDSVQAKAVVALMRRDKKKRVVLIHCDDSYGNDMATAFQNSFNGEVVPLPYDPDRPDFTALLQKADEIIKKGNPAESAVLAVTYNEIIDIMKRIRNNSTLTKVRWYGTDSTALSNEILEDQETVKTAIKVNYTACDYTPYGKYFDPLYQDINFKLRPARLFKESSISAFDGLWLLSCAYLENGVSVDTAVINDYVAKHAFRGVGGVLAFDRNGDRRFGYYKFYQVTENKGRYSWEESYLYSIDYINQGILEMSNNSLN